jgi:hypothetical protein
VQVGSPAGSVTIGSVRNHRVRPGVPEA